MRYLYCCFFLKRIEKCDDLLYRELLIKGKGDKFSPVSAQTKLTQGCKKVVLSNTRCSGVTIFVDVTPPKKQKYFKYFVEP